jgi:hypothetical protein
LRSASTIHSFPASTSRQNLGQGIGGLATLAIPKAARIKDIPKDRLQTIDQRLLLTYSVVDRGYAQWPCLAGGSSFRNLQSSHGLRLIGVFAKLLMEPFQILIQTGLNSSMVTVSAPLAA